MFFRFVLSKTILEKLCVSKLSGYDALRKELASLATAVAAALFTVFIDERLQELHLNLIEPCQTRIFSVWLPTPI